MAAPGARGGSRCELTWGLLGLLYLGGVLSAGEPQEGQVRLAGGPHRCAGRVEVFHAGRWGTVCDDAWDLPDAQVSCRQVRCGPALWAPGAAQFGRGSGVIWLDETRCSGGEAHLAECPARTWGRNNCYHGEDAGAVCADSLEPEPPHLRLAGGGHRCEGRVELLHLDRWAGVCGHTWGQREAQVVCRYLGCGTPVAASPGHTPGDAPGDAPGQVWLERVSCEGTERNLSQCKAGPWQEHTCAQGGVANVTCSGSALATPPQVRLADGPHRCAGRVEVSHLGRWGTVCDDSWGFAAAAVVCRYLGCGQVIAAPPRARFGPGSGPVWLDGLTCTGEEGALSECRHKGWGVHTCEHSEDAGVVCAGSGLADLTHLRLAEGPHRCAGRVQVQHEGRWGGVCGLTWALPAADVTCRYLGCGPALRAGQVSVGTEELTWVESLRCNGSEGNLLECQVKVWGAPHCPHATATCAQPGEALPPSNATVAPSGAATPHPDSGLPGAPQVRLSGAPDRCAGRVEVLHEHLWGTVCDDTWGLRHAQVVCAHLGCGRALEAPGAARYGRGSGPIWLDDVTCRGDEPDLFRCDHRTWGEHNCHHGEDAGVVCAGNSSSGEVRLVAGPHLCAGRVEVLHEGRWGTVCQRGWDLRDAQVVCRQVGCGRALEAPGKAWFGQGSGQVWLSDLTCAGSEQHLGQCPGPTWGSNTCGHSEDAGVVCAAHPFTPSPAHPSPVPPEPFQVRLADGPHRCAGRVEVSHLGRWGTVCDDSWDLSAARVTCRHLGCGPALSAPGRARFGPGRGPVWLDQVRCSGEELTLDRCERPGWGEHDCDHGEDAGVVCAGANPPQVRLRDGPGPCAGQVQVQLNHTWLQVCGLTWGLPEAQVLCRQLGCGPALSAPAGPHLPGEPHLAGLTCDGSESQLLECFGEWAGPSTCAGGVAQVRCVMPKGVAPTCTYLVALLVLMMSLGGALLWLTLRARCVPGEPHLARPSCCS